AAAWRWRLTRERAPSGETDGLRDARVARRDSETWAFVDSGKSEGIWTSKRLPLRVTRTAVITERPPLVVYSIGISKGRLGSPLFSPTSRAKRCTAALDGMVIE